MNNIQIFSNSEFGEIRMVIIGGEPWFVSKDIAEKLGYTRTSNMVKLVDEDDKKNISSSDLEQQVYSQNYTIGVINESGLYAAIFGSKLESAKRFKHWVTSEVLPSIHRTGSYGIPKDTDGKIALLAQGHSELRADINNVRTEVENLKNSLPVFITDAKDIQNAIRKKAIEVLGGTDSNAYHDRSIRGYAFSDIQIEVRRQFGVKRYDQIKHKDVPTALKIVEDYKPPFHIREKIEATNAQLSFDLEGGTSV